MAKLGLMPKPGTPQQFGTFLEAERKAWADAVDVTGVKID
jgi:hypothetical protein